MIYLDHNATTPVHTEVLDAMMPYLTTEWGNPSSTYKFGSKIKSAVESAREQVASLISAKQNEIMFTSCATESNNAAIASALRLNPQKRHIVTSAVEHSSVLNYCMSLEKQGYMITYLPVDCDGLLNVADLDEALSDDTAIVSVMWANNETGVLFPIAEIASVCHSRGVLFHCDAVQAAGKIKINIHDVAIDYLSLTGHKLGAPKGIGALYIRRKAPFVPYIYGGHQERSLRGGTESVPLIIGFGKACEIALDHLPQYETTIRPLRDSLEAAVLASIPGTTVNGHPVHRLANTSNISFNGFESEALLILLDQEGICASSGSACLADSDEPSHVIKAMRPDTAAARQMIRFSLGEEFAECEIERVTTALCHATSMLQLQ